jgi:hypothetical protein
MVSKMILADCFSKENLGKTSLFPALSSVGISLSHSSEEKDIRIYGNPVWVLFPYATDKFYEFANIDKFMLDMNVKGIIVLANEEDEEEIMHLVNTHKLKAKINVLFPEKNSSFGEKFHGVHLYDVKKTARMMGTIVKVSEEDEMEYHAR